MEVNEASHVTQGEEDEGTHGAKSQQEFETFQPKAVLENVKSVVWQFLTFRGAKGKGPDKNRVYCRLCPNDKMSSKNKKQPGISYSGGTSYLSAHLKFHHPKEFLEAESEEKIINTTIPIPILLRATLRLPRSNTSGQKAVRGGRR
jgi:hypothetical protein